ncbi:MAG: L-threonylcarbamoyladenylate synthase [Chloroflexota bacterium]|nr:L-threonylcarbamoyladenylate synthase [Chloroflexota bacterium]
MTAITSTERFATAVTPPPGHQLRELNAGVLRLLEGGVIAVPTDTLFGLAADVLNEKALSRVFDIKGRPADLALPVLVGDWEQVGMVAEVESDATEYLAAEFWPGSLTLVLPRRAGLSPVVTGGRDTVAVRMPNHWVPLNMAANLGSPISGTSANRSGGPDLKSLEELRTSLGDRVDAIIEVGPPPAGVQSTIVDMTKGSPMLIREGATSFDEVLKAWERVKDARIADDIQGGRHG